MLSLIVPTLNEVENLRPLLWRIESSLRGSDHEVLIVDDDSQDGTADAALALCTRFKNVRVLQRTSNFGLSAAILEGFNAAKGDVLAVMDADLQHDPKVLPKLLSAISSSDIAIGSRYAFQGRTCGWSFLRELQSRLAARLTRTWLQLSPLDPLSGFFMVRRAQFEAALPNLEGRGWKFLLELLALSPNASVAEVPFTFRARVRGKTKMNFGVISTWLSELRRLRDLRGSLRGAPLPLPRGAP